PDWNPVRCFEGRAVLRRRRHERRESQDVYLFRLRAGKRLVAPSKFCAYSAIPLRREFVSSQQATPALGIMTGAHYSRLNDGTHLLDGQRAVAHLTGQLGMLLKQPDEVPDVAAQFNDWVARFSDCIGIHARGSQFVLPPPWYA